MDFNNTNEYLRFATQKVLPLVYDDSLSYYEVQCKLVNKINELIKTDAEFAKGLSEVYRVVNGIEGKVDEVVGDILTTWLNDGTLGKIVGEYVNFNGWIPTGDDIEDFRTDVVRCVVSHMVHAVGTDAVVPGAGGLINIDTPFAAVYSNTLTHESALNFNTNTFDTKRSEEIQGVVLPLGFFDCSSFLALMDSCRIYGGGTAGLYNESPYHYAFKNGLSGDDEGVVGRCCEAGTNAVMPYTFNYLNNIGTARMAYMMDMSGNKLRLIASRTNLNEVPNIFENIVDTLETGDQIFFGKYDRTDIYKRIGHCGIYVKYLDDLDACGAYYNATFRTVGTGAHPEYGYVVHVTGGYSDGVSSSKYKNVMRVDTLYDAVYELNNITAYVAKPYSNALISAKAQRVLEGSYRGNNGTYCATRDIEGNDLSKNYGFSDSGVFRVRNISIGGVELSEGDLNNIDNGVYYIRAAGNTGNILNLPPSLVGSNFQSELFQYGVRPNDTRGVQILTYNTVSDINAKLMFRVGNKNGEWGPWKNVTAVTDE